MPWLNSLANGSGVDTTPMSYSTLCQNRHTAGAAPRARRRRRRGPPASSISPPRDRPGPAGCAGRGTADSTSTSQPIAASCWSPAAPARPCEDPWSAASPSHAQAAARHPARRIVLQLAEAAAAGCPPAAAPPSHHSDAAPGSARPNSAAARTASRAGDRWSCAAPAPVSVRNAIMARFASATVMPSRKPELTSVPSPSQAAVRRVTTSHHADDRKIECPGKRVVSRVMARDRHDGPGAVAAQHVVGDPDRQARRHWPG